MKPIHLAFVSAVSLMGLSACNATIGGNGSPATSVATNTAGFQQPTGDYSLGEKVEYRKGETLHLELFIVEDNPTAQAVLENRPNPVMAAKKADRARRGRPASYKINNPESRAYDMFDAVTKFGLMDFASGGMQGCIFDVVLNDVNPKAFGPAAVLDKADRFTGAYLHPQVTGAREVTYPNLRIREAAPLVLPNGPGVYGMYPTVTMIAKNCVIKNPGSDGKQLTYSMRHRLDNVGQLVSIVIENEMQRQQRLSKQMVRR